MPEDIGSNKKPKDFHSMFGFGDVATQKTPDLTSPLTTKPATTGFDKSYDKWKMAPSPDSMSEVLKSSQPLIDAAVRTHASTRSPLLNSHARIITAEAVKSYDPASKASLQTWISSNLRGLARYSQSLSPIRVPERVAYDRRNMERTEKSLYDDLGRTPTETEIGDQSGLGIKRIRELRKVTKPVVSESELTDDDGAGYLPGVRSNDPESVFAEYVYHDLDPVSQRVYDLLLGRETGSPVGVTEAAKILKLSPGAISQRASKISAKLESYHDVKS